MVLKGLSIPSCGHEPAHSHSLPDVGELTLRPLMPLGPGGPSAPGSPGVPWEESQEVTHQGLHQQDLLLGGGCPWGKTQQSIWTILSKELTGSHLQTAPVYWCHLQTAWVYVITGIPARWVVPFAGLRCSHRPHN